MYGLSCQETDTVREPVSAAASSLGVCIRQIHPRLAARRAQGIPALWGLPLVFLLALLLGIMLDEGDISMGHLGMDNLDVLA
jgi:hypothetical protein